MEQVQTRWNGWGSPGHDDPLAVNEPAWRWLTHAFAMPALLATPPRDVADMVLPPSRLKSGDAEKLAGLLGASGVQQGAFERARHAAGRGLEDLLALRAGDLTSAPDAVLYPRNEGDVLAVLKLCAERGIAVMPFGGGTGDVKPSRGGHQAVVTLNLSDLNRVTLVDAVSGLAEAEAGILGPALERQLAARGMMLGHRPDGFEFSSLGGWIAQPGAGQEGARYGEAPDWLLGLKVVTPQGLFRPSGVPDLKPLLLGSRGALGVITAATIRIRALPAKEEHRAYLFPDFASGLTAVRQALRIGLPHTFLRLSDDGETRLDRALARAGKDWSFRDHMFDVYLSIRRFDTGAARLVAGFAGSDSEVTAARRRFDGLARQLGALALSADRHWQDCRYAIGYRRDTMLDRGAGMDSLTVSASWTKLPQLYVAVRAALKQAMREHAPRAGAHGLVLAHLSGARADSASLTFTWLYPRILGDGITQARQIRLAALAASAVSGNDLRQEILRGAKKSLDPEAILNPAMAQLF
ncbi:MAG TPA: FAD-binding oxidoreductase [Rhizomicrobium sp.]|nr:FAD-binding oxidoreductase [Rhizomicrobium sp.]